MVLYACATTTHLSFVHHPPEDALVAGSSHFDVMPSLVVILAILKNKKLRKVDNLVIVNLLFTDLVYIFVDYSYTMYLASILF